MKQYQTELPVPSPFDLRLAVFGHGAAIRVWAAARSNNIDAEYAATHDLANTGVVVVTGSMAEGWVVEEWDRAPIGGAELEDVSADDPTGEAVV